jgi:hypothetical protein
MYFQVLVMDLEAFLDDDENNDSFGNLVEEWEDLVMDDLEEAFSNVSFFVCRSFVDIFV